MKQYTILHPQEAKSDKINYFYAKNDQDARRILIKSAFGDITTLGINFNLYKRTPKTLKLVRFKENYLQKHGLGKPPRKVKKKNKKYGVPLNHLYFLE